MISWAAIPEIHKRNICSKRASGIVKAYGHHRLLQSMVYNSSWERKCVMKKLTGIWGIVIIYFQIVPEIKLHAGREVNEPAQSSGSK